MCLPKWDKYDKNNIKLFNKKKNKKSIFIFFTKRALSKHEFISSDYINNINKIINNKILAKVLIKHKITLYYCLHRTISYFKYMIKIHNRKQYKYISNHEISSVLIESRLLVTDFSSNKKIYDRDYYEIINDIKTGKIFFENRLNTPKQVINF